MPSIARLAAACPGPLAYQLAVYCGYIRRGVAGGLAVAVAFALAPFLLVLAVAALYQRFAATWQLRAALLSVDAPARAPAPHRAAEPHRAGHPTDHAGDLHAPGSLRPLRDAASCALPGQRASAWLRRGVGHSSRGLIARVAIGDALTIAVALLSVAAPVVIAAAAIVALIAYPLLQPQWVLR